MASYADKYLQDVQLNIGDLAALVQILYEYTHSISVAEEEHRLGLLCDPSYLPWSPAQAMFAMFATVNGLAVALWCATSVGILMLTILWTVA